MRGPKITRVERFGLGINRVDQFLLGFGVEGMFPVIRPFVEYYARHRFQPPGLRL